MSNEVYGFVDLTDRWSNAEAFLDVVRSRTGLGIHILDGSPEYPEDLTNFPPQIAPTTSSCQFAITDAPGVSTATYLIDMLDYAPGASIPSDRISLPRKGAQRIRLLAACLSEMFRESGASRLCVLVTECSQVEQVKHVSITDLEATLLTDCETSSPPCVLYWVESGGFGLSEKRMPTKTRA